MSHARHWATRLTHESKLHAENSFVTLTYSDDKLPIDRGLSKIEFQRFMKRLRERVDDRTIRFFGCGEYSDPPARRPHYHAILFGVDFHEDWRPVKKTPYGLLYTSPRLEQLWGLGHVSIGAVTPQTAGYVAGYALKKATHHNGGENYQRLTEFGEIVDVESEFLLMSRRPGIGRGWWDKYASDAFPSDFLVIQGKKVPVPPYYRNLLNAAGDGLVPASLDIDRQRRKKAAARAADDTTERRLVIDELQNIAATRKPRNVEQ